VIKKPPRPPVGIQPIQKKEVQLKKKRTPPFGSKTKVNPNPNQRYLKKQPIGTHKEHVKQQPGRNAVKLEKSIQVPIQKQLKKSSSEIPKVKGKTKPTPTRKPNTMKPIQKKKASQRPKAKAQPKTVKRPQVVDKSDDRSARPSPNASQRIRNNQVHQQTRSRSMDRESGRGPTKIQTAQDQRTKQEGAVRKQTKIGQGSRPQSRQVRPDAGKQRSR
jgi:hypothetical protein